MNRRNFGKMLAGSVAMGNAPIDLDISTPTVTVSHTWVLEVLKDHYPMGQPAEGVYHIPRDGDTIIPADKQAFKKLTNAYAEVVASREYESEIQDCEDFAFEFMVRAANAGIHIGVAYHDSAEYSHMYNLAVCADGATYAFEPQRNEIVEQSGQYDIQKGVIIL